MKKFILPLLVLLFVGSLFAVESDPSEVVGYFKKTVVEGTVQAIALPFAYSDLSIASVIGDQFSDSDVLQEINVGTSTTYYDGFGWFGELESLDYGYAYYIERVQGNPTADYYFMGKVDPQSFTIDIAGDAAVTAFGLNQAVAIPVDDLLFGANPSDGDQIQEIDTGASSVYYDGFGWFGELTEISPTYGYYYASAPGAAGFSWTYPLPGRNTPAQTLGKKAK